MRLDHNLSLFNGFSDARVPMVGTFGGGQYGPLIDLWVHSPIQSKL